MWKPGIPFKLPEIVWTIIGWLSRLKTAGVLAQQGQGKGTPGDQPHFPGSKNLDGL